ncbi:hypothetical protein GOB57_25035 [Sinorhizobium meliloti]|nr:hypothetical protein [Sinorhizobium meliloti]
MGDELEVSIDEAVRMSLAEDQEHHERSGSVRRLECRVLVRNGTAVVARRPFRRRGCYCVRWSGTAKLVRAARENGVIVFDVSWA